MPEQNFKKLFECIGVKVNDKRSFASFSFYWNFYEINYFIGSYLVHWLKFLLANIKA